MRGIFLIFVYILLAGCSATRHYESGGLLSGATLTIFPDGKVELGSFSDVVTDNCIFVGSWTKVEDSQHEILLEFHSARKVDTELSECDVLPRPQVWRIRSNKAVDSRGAEFRRARLDDA